MAEYKSKFTGSQIDTILTNAQALDNKKSASGYRVLATNGSSWTVLPAGENVTINSNGISSKGGSGSGSLPSNASFDSIRVGDFQTFSSDGLFADGPLNFAGEAINFNQGYYQDSGITYNNCFKQFAVSGAECDIDLNDFTGIAKIYLTLSANNCEGATFYLRFKNNITPSIVWEPDEDAQAYLETYSGGLTMYKYGGVSDEYGNGGYPVPFFYEFTVCVSSNGYAGTSPEVSPMANVYIRHLGAGI